MRELACSRSAARALRSAVIAHLSRERSRRKFSGRFSLFAPSAFSVAWRTVPLIARFDQLTLREILLSVLDRLFEYSLDLSVVEP